ncbi:MAG: hypothetical protein RR270_04460 [Alistipes sp.]
MKRRTIIYTTVCLATGVILAGCGAIRKLEKNDPEVKMRQIVKSDQVVEVPDTTRAQKIISYRKQDGSEVFLAPVTIDSLTQQELMTVAIDEVVISASNRRNLVERNGKINVEFVVTVPEEFQNEKWQLTLNPQLRKGPDTLTFAPLVYSGSQFRAMQTREYERYTDYLDRIVDSAQYFERFGDKGAYQRYMNHAVENQNTYAYKLQRLESMPPEQAMFDKKVGWSSQRERRRQEALMRSYARTTDRKMVRRVTYTATPDDKFDHLNDYFAPRYRYPGIEVLPGGATYTRIRGHYPDSLDCNREEYLHSLVVARKRVKREVNTAANQKLRRVAVERLTYSGYERAKVCGLLRAMSDSAMLINYLISKQFAADQIELANKLDTAELRQNVLRKNKVYHNQMLWNRRDYAFSRLVRHPYPSEARLDTIIRRVDGKIDYHYTEQVAADENTSRLYLHLAGNVKNRSGNSYQLHKSDTLMYNVASMTTFIDETPRYMQRVVLRDAEANARYNFIFPKGKSTLDTQRAENRQQLSAVRELTRKLMTDPIYIIDSITLRATSSPEGSWQKNDRLARERAEALRNVVVSDFRVLYDSLKIAANISLDDSGKVVMEKKTNDTALPNLPNILRTKWLAEDWRRLRELVAADALIANKQELLTMLSPESNFDGREWQIRAKYPKAYTRMRDELYPQMRAVDFRFNLHRRGMQQDTVYTTEIDSSYMHAVELLKKRHYDEALTVLREYDDRNTALAYMSLGYDAAAYRILRAEPHSATTADLQYMMAILAARLNDEQQAVRHFLRAVELRENLKFRGNLDPEISRLIRKYGLFREEF